MKSYYEPGQWNCICDVCGFQFKSGMMRKRWDGMMVCDKDFEVRNPQDFIKIPEEKPSPPWVRTEPDDVFVNVTFRSINPTTKDVT